MERNNELAHYGVKGMRWGRRRAIKDAYIEGYRKSAEKSGAKSHGVNVGGRRVMTVTKFKSNKDRRDAHYDGRHAAEMYKRSENKAVATRKSDFRNTRKAVGKSRSTGAKLATNLLAGAFANRTYNSVIAAGGSKNEARAMTAVAAILGVGSPFGHLAVSAFYTHEAGNERIKRQ